MAYISRINETSESAVTGSSARTTTNSQTGGFDKIWKMKVGMLQMQGWAMALSNDQITEGEVSAINNVIPGNAASFDATGVDKGKAIWEGAGATFMAQVNISQIQNQLDFFQKLESIYTSLYDRMGNMQ
jgi:hypothetical protein